MDDITTRLNFHEALGPESSEPLKPIGFETQCHLNDLTDRARKLHDLLQRRDNTRSWWRQCGELVCEISDGWGHIVYTM